MLPAPSVRAAVIAARLIARDGYRWHDAIEQAALEFGERPDGMRLATELRRWYATFSPGEHYRSLRRKRNAALALMTFLEERIEGVKPKLVGRILDGAASKDAVAEVIIDTTDEKAVRIALLNENVPFEDVAPQDEEDALLAVHLSDEPVLLAIWTRPRVRRPATRPDAWQHPLESMGEVSTELLSVLLVHRPESEQLD